MVRGRWPVEQEASGVRPRPPALAPRPERGLDLQEFLSVLWLRKWLIMPIVLVTLGVALSLSSRQTPIYESRASVLVTPIETGTGSEPRSPNLATEAELVSSVVVAQIVAKNPDTQGDPSKLLGDLSVDQPTDTEILDISYRDPDPVRAQRLATGFAQGYLEYRRDVASREISERAQEMDAQIDALKQRLKDIGRQLLRLPNDDPRRGSLEVEAASLRNLILQTQIARLSLPGEVSGGQIIRPASVPGSPISPDHVVNGMFGLAAGLALGVGLALMRDRMSGRLRSSEELEEYLEAPVLAAIPRVPQWRSRRKAYLVTSARWQSPAAEAYRVLRTNLLSAASEVGAKSRLVRRTRY